ncbi:DeoR/GlpR family DNA-binding transcription regulator [Subtercola vilae]|uniref:DeoR/GlpR transcriptional regulator n=1 Tax=Subtercola vilae TaxID=2056433 RepID=A0A4T2BUZ3_9MICO|nr:DeoR/GlpR family DNA-binding transcription regulator [Subtercola vilae]TIH35307.1 DeoR/GlpR transcriptional regulator [Subtercola vilae]
MILEALRADGAVSISSLAESLETSAVTIRRDLVYLDSVGMLTRTHGGAVAGPPSRESSYAEKIVQAIDEKYAIGRLAATLVHDGDVIIIGPGTTTEAFAESLLQKTGLTVITNSLPVAEAFVQATANEVIMTGGTLRASIRAFVGEATNRTLRGIHADKTFVSGNGLVADFGLSTPNMTVADSDRAMAAAGHEIVALVDHTKFGVRTAIQTISTEQITHLVTDAEAPVDQLGLFARSGTTLHVAKPGTGLLDTI